MMENKNYKNGLIYALSCAVIWGFLPIYWDALNPISSLVVIFYRVTLMTLTCFLIQYYQTRNINIGIDDIYICEFFLADHFRTTGNEGLFYGLRLVVIHFAA